MNTASLIESVKSQFPDAVSGSLVTKGREALPVTMESWRSDVSDANKEK